MILATASHLADLQRTTDNIVGVALVLWGLGLFVLLIVVSVRAALVASELKKQTQSLEAIQQHLAKTAAVLEEHQSQGAWIVTHIETNNNLTRQLLRAYGHEPEA